MEFNDYCVVIVENNDNIKDELKKVSEIDLKCLQDKDISICVVSTSMYSSELYELLKVYEGTFFLIDLNSKGLRYNVGDEITYEHLFSELNRFKNDKKKDVNDNSLSDEEIQDRIDKILDKDELTARDKYYLDELTKKNNKKEN